MTRCLGNYKGTVPLPLITRERINIGNASPELAQLIGIRLGVMSEPSKNNVINEGPMKELTGGDPLQARALYKDSVTFIPQFKLVVCTNTLFDIESNDDGTWRRIRKCPFVSKFYDQGEEYQDDTVYKYPKDKSLNEKLHKFAPVFASMLVRKAFENDGIVPDCETVMEASRNYRNGQDHISAFISEKIRKTGNQNHSVKKKGLVEEFKNWFLLNQNSRKMPKSDELYEALTKRFKIHPHHSKGWVGLEFIRDEDEDEDALENIK